MIYTVFSTSLSPYMDWQSELLEYSWNRVGQPGELVRLVATDGSRRLPQHRHARSVATEPWQIHPVTGDDYAPYNKPASLLEWLRKEEPEGTVLLLDPDCVFRAPVRREVPEGKPVAQRWVGISHTEGEDGFGLGPRFGFLESHGVRARVPAQLGMIPKLIHTRDLGRIAARWLELTALVRQEVTDREGRRMWESDMYGYAIVAAEAGLVHELASLGICTNWPPDDAPDAPIIHYCQAIQGQRGEFLWSKHRYRPWDRVPPPEQARLDYGRDLLALLSRHVNRRAGAELAEARPRQRRGVRELDDAGELALRVPGSNRELALNGAARRIWQLCDGVTTVAEMARALERDYASGDGELYEALTEALASLEETGVLVFERG